MQRGNSSNGTGLVIFLSEEDSRLLHRRENKSRCQKCDVCVKGHWSYLMYEYPDEMPLLYMQNIISCPWGNHVIHCSSIRRSSSSVFDHVITHKKLHFLAFCFFSPTGPNPQTLHQGCNMSGEILLRNKHNQHERVALLLGERSSSPEHKQQALSVKGCCSHWNNVLACKLDQPSWDALRKSM